MESSLIDVVDDIWRKEQLPSDGERYVDRYSAPVDRYKFMPFYSWGYKQEISSFLFT